MRSVAAAILVSLAQAIPLLAAAQEPPLLPPGGVVPPPAPQPPYVRTAPPQSSSTSLGLRLGMYNPSSDDMQRFNEGLDLEATVGVQIHPNVTLEGGIGYYRSSSDRYGFFDPAIGTASEKDTLSVIPITGSVRVGAQVERVSFYGLAGVGLHMASLEADYEYDIYGSGAESGTVSDDDSAFGFHLGAGVGIQVSPTASIGLEVRRTFADVTLFEEDGDIGGLRVGATLAFRL